MISCMSVDYIYAVTIWIYSNHGKLSSLAVRGRSPKLPSCTCGMTSCRFILVGVLSLPSVLLCVDVLINTTRDHFIFRTNYVQLAFTWIPSKIMAIQYNYCRSAPQILDILNEKGIYSVLWDYRELCNFYPSIFKPLDWMVTLL